jgi:hypothetical protein
MSWAGNWAIAGLIGLLLGYCWVNWVITRFWLGFLGYYWAFWVISI